MITAVLCDGAKAPAPAIAAADGFLALTSAGDRGEPNIRMPALDLKLRGAVPPVAVDLLRIAAFVYWADQMVRRPVNTDVEGSRWKRTFVMCIPVAEPELWRDPAVDKALTLALSYGTDDEWLFHFVGSAKTAQRYLLPAGVDSVSGADCVLLFSGGTDSLTAAALEAERGIRPLLVSHGSSTRVRPKQDALRQALQTQGPGWGFPHRFVEVTKRAVSEKERTQRSRGFLYSAMGAAVARCLEIEDVVLADNGFVSVGLPLNGQTVGARMSRTTHPKFQRLFNGLCELVVPGIRIRNPLLFQTRAEGLTHLRRLNLHESLRSAHSCAASGRLTNYEGHCGRCSQCLDRRVGVVASGLESYDVTYKHDIFRDELTDDALTLGESYVRLIRKLIALEGEPMLVEFSELLDCASPDVAERDVPERVVEMLRRQAEAATDAMHRVTEPILDRLLNGEFATTSLVRLWLAGTPPPRKRQWRSPEVEEIGLSASEAAAFDKAKCKSRLLINLTGESRRPKSNVVDLAGTPVEFADAEFILLLRLVLALWETQDGFVLKGGGRRPGGIADEPEVVPGNIDQAIGRLREKIQLGSGRVDPKDIVEVNNKRVRLSTISRYVQVNREALLNHDREVVRELASRLPFIRA